MRSFIKLTWLLAAFFAAGSPALADEEAPALLVDPPVYISNLSGQSAKLVWQTLLPDRALSPQRGSDVAAGVSNLKAKQGFYVFTDPSGGETLKNIVFVSILGDDDSIVAQSRFEIEAHANQSHEDGLAITLGEDGAVSVAQRGSQ